MLGGILESLGGLGLFLLGMSVMTQGLRTVADDRLRSLLRRSTKNPLQGVMTGALATAVVQSSSVTTVAAVGFVDAGLLNFSEALGIIFGANIGTTITGWLVALLGFKLKLGEAMLPAVLLGVLMRIFGRGKLESAGTALAGFGLIFFGISILGQGMDAFQGIVTPDSFPPDTIGGRLLLVVIGMAITAVTQSSSAGVAAALTAVHGGSISLEQAAAMVIGMDLGTTFKAAMATIGGNVQARRTGFAHVIYNAMTAIAAFLLLSPYLQTVARYFPKSLQDEPEIVLVGFHTFFNTFGVIAVLPFTKQFAQIITRLFPERGNPLAKRLDKTLLTTPEMALHAVTATAQDIMRTLFGELNRWLGKAADGADEQLIANCEDALRKTREYLQQLQISPKKNDLLQQYLACIHVLDHLRRVARRLKDQARLRRCRADDALSKMTDELATSCQEIAATTFPLSTEEAEKFHGINHRLKDKMRTYRAEVIARAAGGEITPETAIRRMDAARWLRRIGYHIWRISRHMTAEDVSELKGNQKD